MKTNINALWLVSPQIRAMYSEDGAVLLDIQKGLCYSLNPVGARVWCTLEASPSGIDLQGLLDVLEPDYSISRDELEDDVDEYILKLERVGLLRRKVLLKKEKEMVVGAGR